jgi:hypothetical protein
MSNAGTLEDIGGVTLYWRRLESGYIHIGGAGVCNWAQPLGWPLTEADLYASPDASGAFIAAAMRLSRKMRGTGEYAEGVDE